MSKDASIFRLLAINSGSNQDWIYSVAPLGSGTALRFEEARSHPEKAPLLRLANYVEGAVVSEVWFYPEDLFELVVLLEDQHHFYQLRPGEERVEQLDLYEESGDERPRRPPRTVRQYYGDPDRL